VGTKTANPCPNGSRTEPAHGQLSLLEFAGEKIPDAEQKWMKRRTESGLQGEEMINKAVNVKR